METEQSALLQDVRLVEVSTQLHLHENQDEPRDHVSDVHTDASESMR